VSCFWTFINVQNSKPKKTFGKNSRVQPEILSVRWARNNGRQKGAKLQLEMIEIFCDHICSQNKIIIYKKGNYGHIYSF
jgi:hypothetical protein